MGVDELSISAEYIEDTAAQAIAGDGNISVNYDDATDTIFIDTSGLNSEQTRDAVAAFIQADPSFTVTHNDSEDTLTIGFDNSIDLPSNTSIGGESVWNTGNLSVVTEGAVQLSNGLATIDTGVSDPDAAFMLALGVDTDDSKVGGRVFRDSGSGTYNAQIVERGTSVGNPTVDYKVLRVY